VEETSYASRSDPQSEITRSEPCGPGCRPGSCRQRPGRTNCCRCRQDQCGCLHPKPAANLKRAPSAGNWQRSDRLRGAPARCTPVGCRQLHLGWRGPRRASAPDRRGFRWFLGLRVVAPRCRPLLLCAFSAPVGGRPGPSDPTSDLTPVTAASARRPWAWVTEASDAREAPTSGEGRRSVTEPGQ
jgi:hypothetical protein